LKYISTNTDVAPYGAAKTSLNSGLFQKISRSGDDDKAMDERG
jgi:hypothetical protein